MRTATLTTTQIIADGFDALIDGRGWNSDHQEAQELANAAPGLLAACRILCQAYDAGEEDGGIVDGDLLDTAYQKAHEALVKAGLR